MGRSESGHIDVSARGAGSRAQGAKALPRFRPLGRIVSIRFKLMLYFAVLVLVPLVMLSIIGPSLYSRAIEREATDHTIRMIGQVGMNIEFHVQEMERLIDLLSKTEEVAAFFDASRRDPGWKESSARMLAAVSGSHPEIAGIILVNRGGEWQGDDFYRITRDPLTEESWYAAALRTPGTVSLVARPIGRNLRNKRPIAADEVVSVIKPVSDERTGEVLGVAAIDMKLSTVEDIFKGTAVGEKGFLFIADSAGDIVYAPVNKVVYRVPLDALAGDSSSMIASIGGADYQVVARRSSYTGWRTIGVLSLAETLREIVYIRFWSLSIGAMTLAIGIAVSLFFTSSIARPVLRLRNLMKCVEGGDLSVRFSGGTGDEISELGLGFNEMIARIQGLIEQVYCEQLQKREAELRILQEQIKPHFLYNTLDTIQWMAREHREDEVVCLVQALTTLFRIGLSKGKEYITLSDELQHVESYLCIQKMRYEDKFDYRITAEDGLEPDLVPRLILQPLVENAIYHGIKEKLGHGNLEIEATRQQGDLLIFVRDDGAGMDEETLASIQAGFDSPSDGDIGYGIRNVNERVRLTFGARYGLRYTSARGKGTEVIVRLPAALREGT